MSSSSPHIVVFPFMAKGHAIPLLHLSRLLLRHGAAVTLLTTPANRPFFLSSLPSSAAAAISLIDIPFPQDIPGIPPGVESTDKLPDISLWPPFAAATKLMQPHFDHLLENLLPPVSLIISDDFLHWTLDSASRRGVPRLAFYAIGAFSLSVTIAFARRRFAAAAGADALTPTDLPWINIRREDVDPLLIDPKFAGTDVHNYLNENIESSSRSHGILVNTFHELESAYVDTWNSAFGPKMWCLGPFSQPPAETVCIRTNRSRTSASMRWLDGKVERGEKVLYAAFGTQVEISPEQFEAIKTGLEKSGVNFLWVVRRNEEQLDDGFEERVRERGIVVREWVDQREILGHGGVGGFLSQCGWTSVVESVCAGVPILAMPGMWEQPLNAVLVAEELKVGIRVERCEGFVKWESLAAAVRELMGGELGEEVRRNAAELRAAAASAVEEGGSSWVGLKELLSQFGQTDEKKME